MKNVKLRLAYLSHLASLSEPDPSAPRNICVAPEFVVALGLRNSRTASLSIRTLDSGQECPVTFPLLLRPVTSTDSAFSRVPDFAKKFYCDEKRGENKFRTFFPGAIVPEKEDRPLLKRLDRKEAIIETVKKLLILIGENFTKKKVWERLVVMKLPIVYKQLFYTLFTIFFKKIGNSI